MKKMSIALLVAISSNSAFALCKTSNVYSDIECYEKQLKSDKSKLNKLYGGLYGKLDDEGKTQLELSQKSWLDYRNKQCGGLVAYFASQSLGAGPKLITISCEAEKTQDRLKELKDLDY